MENSAFEHVAQAVIPDRHRGVVGMQPVQGQGIDLAELERQWLGPVGYMPSDGGT